MRPKEGGHFRPPTPEPSVPARVSAETTRAAKTEVVWRVWAGLSAAMSASLLRRGLELLGGPEGEEGLLGHFQRERQGGGDWGRGGRIRELRNGRRRV